SLLPEGSTAPERRKRTSRACTSMGSCSTSSRNRVPPCASSSLPSRRTGPPLPGTSAPKRSASICNGRAPPQLAMTNGPCRRRPERCSDRARRSLPTPGSPERSTWTGGSIAARSCSTTCFMASELPTTRLGSSVRSCCPGCPGRMGSYHPTWCTSPSTRRWPRAFKPAIGDHSGSCGRKRGKATIIAYRRSMAPKVRWQIQAGVPARSPSKQRLAARQPRLVGRHHQLDAGVLLVAKQQEKGAASEIAQHLLDQGLRGGAALRVGQHPLADPVEVLDHPLRSNARRPDRRHGIGGRRLLGPRDHVLHQQGHHAQ